MGVDSKLATVTVLSLSIYGNLETRLFFRPLFKEINHRD